MNKQHVPPPMLFAQLRVLAHHQIPLRSRRQVGQHVRAKQNQRAQRRHNAKQSGCILVQQPCRLLPLQLADDRVRRQQTAEHKEDVRVDGGRATNDGPHGAQRLGHLRAIHVRIEEQRHRFVRHHQQEGVHKANAVHCLDVAGVPFEATQRAHVFAQWKRHEVST